MFIEGQRMHYPVRMLCRVLGVSPSGYYAWRKRPLSPRAQADAQLWEVLQQEYQRSRQTYGSPRLHQALVRLGHHCGRHRVARLMRRGGLRGIPPRRYVCTTQRDPAQTGAPDRLQRDFSAEAPNRKWASDLSHIETGQGWLYLATVLDLFSRRVVGWAMAEHMRDESVLAGLQIA